MSSLIEAHNRPWAASPCSTCPTSPCCTRLPLHRFHIDRRIDFEEARSVVRHPLIELGLYESGWWMVYYLASCRFLNPLDSKCLVHGTERQPAICRDYSPMRCWYKRVFMDEISPDFLRFDTPRFAVLEGLISFDETGELSRVPSWETMQATLAAVPIRNPSAPHEPADTPEGGATGLMFPMRTPRTRQDLDLVRFRLGFQGVRIGIAGGTWIIVIGEPPGIERSVLLSYDRIDTFLAAFEYDEAGRIIRSPLLENKNTPSPG